MSKAKRFASAAVACPDHRASIAGLEVLKAGGNAVDAALATNFVLAVVAPHLCGAGGDLFAMVFSDGQLYGLNSSGKLPAGARLPADERVPRFGVESATVPGAAAGWVSLSERLGSMSLEQLTQPAIKLANEGFEPAPTLKASLEKSRKLLSRDSETARIFLAPPPIRNPELAITLADLPGFYSGPVAHNAPSPFLPSDFVQHKAEWVQPQRAEWLGHEVYEMPPNSRGHLVLKALSNLESLEGLTDQDPEFHLRLIRAIGAERSSDTIYLCVRDAGGMSVSLNQSNYMGFGSGVMIPGTGVHLHNRGAYLSPGEYREGARPTHTLAPAMALRGGRPSLIFGTMGGEAQTQIHLQILARILHLGQDPGDAVSAPRWVKREDTDLVAEEGLPYIGAQVIPVSSTAGHAHVIQVTDEGLLAAADPRSDGSALGY